MTEAANPSGNAEQPTMAHATSLSLLVRAQGRDAKAWERLVDLYAPLVHHWCRRCGLSADDTADVFQEVFRSVAEHLGGFRKVRPGDTFRGWLRTITRNKVHDHFRRREGHAPAVGGTDAQLRLLAVPDAAILDDDDPSETDLVTRQLHRALADIRGEFEERTWRAFWGVQVDNRGSDEVATELSMTPAAVRKAKYRVLRRLREELGDLLD
ncbi:MAG: sigma-70 family RNA polymerase sigma factor [Gemmataceae bacterium]|nr:sigma-70 family RNA polymerase sigma factor [Gemmataceae bacterium]